MNDRVLFVDDDEKILRFAERSLGRKFQCVTARSADEALRILQNEEPVAVIVSDENMPGTRGTRLLAETRRISPDTTRIMLTGYADQSIAVDAVNEGAVFRFLNKPVRMKTLIDVVELGMRQYRLVTAERELLDRTLRETARTLSDLLALVRPAVFGRAARLRRLVRLLGPHLPRIADWELEMAVALAQTGLLDASPQVEWRRLAQNSEAGALVISRIPRLESIAGGIRYQYKNFDGSGYPEDGIDGRKIPLLGRVLRLINEWDGLQAEGGEPDEIAQRLREAPGRVDPDLLEYLAEALQAERPSTTRVPTDQLPDDVVLAEDIITDAGTLLACRGHRVDDLLRQRLKVAAESGQSGVLPATTIVVDSYRQDSIGDSGLPATG